MTVNEAIKTFDLRLTTSNGADAFYNNKKATKTEMAWLVAHKEEIKVELRPREDAAAKERAEKDAATVMFRVIGWEAHEVSIDKRGDIEAQLHEIADRYSEDAITYEIVKAAYEQVTAKTTAVSTETVETPAQRAASEAKAAKWDAAYNEGAEGYNPYRAPETTMRDDQIIDG